MKNGSKSDEIITIPAEDKPTHKGYTLVRPLPVEALEQRLAQRGSR